MTQATIPVSQASAAPPNANSRQQTEPVTPSQLEAKPHHEAQPDHDAHDKSHLGIPAPEGSGINWSRVFAPLSIHLLALGVIWVGWSWTAVGVALLLYVLRMFVITGWYHRYFSHRTFNTSRVMQGLFAFLGSTCAQRGPLWWSAHHREHHRHSDEEIDVHSPRQHGLIWSHMGWFVSEPNMPTNLKAVPDLAKYPELRFIDRFHLIGVAALCGAMYGLGAALATWAPGLETSGLQMLVWGFGVSTVLLYHGTFTINSLSHVFGKRRFDTKDDSKNNWFLAIITLGEGWHNNHHYYPGSTRQGFFWWEFDPTFYTLWVMQKLGLVWNLRGAPARVYERVGK